MSNRQSIETNLIRDLSIDEIDQVIGALSLGGIIDLIEAGKNVIIQYLQIHRGLEIMEGLMQESAPPVPFKDPGIIA